MTTYLCMICEGELNELVDNFIKLFFGYSSQKISVKVILVRE